jgi:hypothetical protein
MLKQWQEQLQELEHQQIHQIHQILEQDLMEEKLH